jgi:hypothetical protein
MASGLVSWSRNTRLFTPETPGRARTVSMVEYRYSCFGRAHGPCQKASPRPPPDTSREATEPSAATIRTLSPLLTSTSTASRLPSSARTCPSLGATPSVTLTTSMA